MGNTVSTPKNVQCSMYKHTDIVNAIYTVLVEYEPDLEAMCDCASWMLRELLIKYRKYSVDEVELLCGKVKGINHIWVHDKKEDYYIDITSEQFKFPKCLCSKNKKELDDLGYVVTHPDSTEQVCDMFCKAPCVLYDKEKEITKEMILRKITKKLGGKRKSTYKNKNRMYER
jgi:hypothetical protein